MIDLNALLGIDERQTKKELAQTEEKINIAGDVARACLGNENFGVYRKRYQDASDTLMDTLISYTKRFVEGDGGDITKYALTVVRMITKMQHLRYLLKTVEIDSKRGLNNEKETEAETQD